MCVFCKCVSRQSRERGGAVFGNPCSLSRETRAAGWNIHGPATTSSTVSNATNKADAPWILRRGSRTTWHGLQVRGPPPARIHSPGKDESSRLRTTPLYYWKDLQTRVPSDDPDTPILGFRCLYRSCASCAPIHSFNVTAKTTDLHGDAGMTTRRTLCILQLCTAPRGEGDLIDNIHESEADNRKRTVRRPGGIGRA